ncbi:unnamed protein product, partial [Hymenolepis diminuta]
MFDIAPCKDATPTTSVKCALFEAMDFDKLGPGRSPGIKVCMKINFLLALTQTKIKVNR